MNVTPDTTEAPDIAPAKIEFRCQAPGDHAKLEAVCPKDQSVAFVGRWVDGLRFVMEKVLPAKAAPAAVAAPAIETDGQSDGQPGGDQAGGEDEQAQVEAEVARVTALGNPALRELAAERGVKWLAGMSRPTVVNLVAAADPRFKAKA